MTNKKGREKPGREGKNAQGILLEEEELNGVNGGMRVQSTRTGAGQADGETPDHFFLGGGVPVDDEALEDVSGGMMWNHNETGGKRR